MGAGNARHRLDIENAGYQWVGCDLKADGRIQLRADAHKLPFVDETFDLVNVWQVMEHLRNPWQAISEIQRVLKPGGLIIGSVSFLEPVHGMVYFGFSQYGLEEILKGSRFENIILFPGIGCFPLICWTWIRQLTGNQLMAKAAMVIAKVGVWGISLVLDRISLIKELLGSGQGSRRRWIREIMPLHFAGHITFRATKEDSL